MQPIISIIIPIYNVLPYLRQCIDSVLRDNAVPNMEVILVDDGSTDGSGGLVDTYVNQFRDISVKGVHQVNAGLGAARNTGLSLATGKYVYFLDSDDYLYCGVLGKMIDFVEKNDLEVACFNVLKDGEEPYFTTSFNIDVVAGNQFAEQFREHCGFSYVAPVWMYLFSREFLLNNNLWNKVGVLHEDEEFTPRMLFYAQRMALLNIPIQFHRVKREGAITSIISLKHLRDSCNSIIELTNFFKKHPEVTAISAGIIDFWILTMQKTYDNHYEMADVVMSRADVRRLALLTKTPFPTKLIRLAVVSLSLMVKYYRNELPIVVRKCINRII